MARVKPYDLLFCDRNYQLDYQYDNSSTVSTSSRPLVFQISKAKLETLRYKAHSQQLADLASSVLDKSEGHTSDAQTQDSDLESVKSLASLTEFTNLTRLTSPPQPPLQSLQLPLRSSPQSSPELSPQLPSQLPSQLSSHSLIRESESLESLSSFIPSKRRRKVRRSFKSPRSSGVPDQNFITACTFPPSDRAVDILKRLSNGKILPHKELDYAVMYVSFLKGKSQQYRRKNRVVDLFRRLSDGKILPDKELDNALNYINFLKGKRKHSNDVSEATPSEATQKSQNYRTSRGPLESLTSATEIDSKPPAPEEMDVSDDEPPILSSSVTFPIPAKGRSASLEDYSFPDSLPHLRAVLRSERKGGPSEKPRKVPPSRQSVTCEMCGTRMTRFTSRWWHSNVCSGVVVKSHVKKRPKASYRHCPRCDKILTTDKEFEVHMAVTHRYYWYLEFENEKEFLTWYRKEGLDETMHILSNSIYTRKAASTVRHRTYSCAKNGSRRVMKKYRCPSHMYVRVDEGRYIVKYWPAHSHPQKIVRVGISRECREIIEKMVNEGARDKAIVEKVKSTYPPSSINQTISKDSIAHIRRRLKKKKQNPKDGQKEEEKDWMEAEVAQSGSSASSTE